jgi:hypothetical protein
MNNIYLFSSFHQLSKTLTEKNVHPLNLCSDILLLLLFTQTASKRQKHYTLISRKITTITGYLNGSEGHSEQGEVNCNTGRRR